MVDGIFLQINIQVQWLVQHVTSEQMRCCAKVGVPGSTFLVLLFNSDKQFAK